MKLLNSSSEMLYIHEPEKNPILRSLHIKIMMLFDIISKSAEEFESLDILKVFLEDYTDIFQDGKSISIETLKDGTLKISAENK